MAISKPPPEQRYDKRLSAATNAELRYIHKEHRLRVRRIYKSITHNREFAATALWHENDIDATDSIFQLIPGGYLSADGETKVLYADGSYRCDGPEEGLSAAAVVYQGRDWCGDGTWETESIAFERDVGSSHDAELYAIKMALEIALRLVSEQQYGMSDRIANVVIFTDAQDIVMLLAGVKECPCILGPVPLDEKWALQDVYEDAASLKEAGINVIIAWQKGHGRGFRKSEGNQRADEAAKSALLASSSPVDDDAEPENELDTIGMIFYEKPKWSDIKEEYLYRKSGRWFRSGKGICHINPSLSGIVPRGSDRYVERPVAPPLQHLFPTTRVLPKEGRVLDFRKCYTEGLKSIERSK